MLTDKGWVWSPAYDLNPTNINTQSLLISRGSNESSLTVLLEAASDYMLSADVAQRIIDEVRAAMTEGKKMARQCGISDSEKHKFI